MIKKENALKVAREKHKDKVEELTKMVEKVIMNTPPGYVTNVDCEKFPLVVVEIVLQDLKDAGWDGYIEKPPSHTLCIKLDFGETKE